jgi:hypothetical protein
MVIYECNNSDPTAKPLPHIVGFDAGPAAAPSQVVDMGIAEFVARLQPGCSLPLLLYTPQEHYYMQVGGGAG